MGDAFPDILLIDGGKGQLNAAMAAFRDQEITPPTVISLAKRKKRSFGRAIPNRSSSAEARSRYVCCNTCATNHIALPSTITTSCGQNRRSIVSMPLQIVDRRGHLGHPHNHHNLFLAVVGV